MSAAGGELSTDELGQLRDHGLDEADARRQLALLRSEAPAAVRLAAPCTTSNGIETSSEEERELLLASWETAAAEGRILKFVPASGLASRMFESLERALHSHRRLTAAELEERSQAGDTAARDCLRFQQAFASFPFAEAVRRHLQERGLSADRLLEQGDVGTVLEALLAPAELGYAARPKALIEFHAAADGARTAAMEQLAEAVALTRDRRGVARAHFTVAPSTRRAFRAALEPSCRATNGEVELGLSEQSPTTDTIAIDERGNLCREDAAGGILFRAGGHGALLRNLERLAADLVLIKNIDNVQPESRRHESLLWQRLLIGRLVHLESEAQRHLESLSDGGEPRAKAAGESFWHTHFGGGPGDVTGAGGDGDFGGSDLLERLARPIRICGMVPAAGEPGGGPFWVEEPDGTLSKQIVEESEVCSAADQRDLLRSSTHFNPVLMALAMRNWRGEQHELERYVDHGRYFRSRRSAGGSALRALERPGLWNGSMALWNTVFVEVPAAVFTPVKSVFDLLRAAHQPADGNP